MNKINGWAYDRTHDKCIHGTALGSGIESGMLSTLSVSRRRLLNR
jgi:hypothetical protein